MQEEVDGVCAGTGTGLELAPLFGAPSELPSPKWPSVVTY